MDKVNLTVSEMIHSHPWLVSSPTRPEGLVIDHLRNHSQPISANKWHYWVRCVRNIWNKTLNHFCGKFKSALGSDSKSVTIWRHFSNCLQSQRLTNESQWCKSWFHEPKGWISPPQPLDDRWLVNHKAWSFSNPLCPHQSHYTHALNVEALVSYHWPQSLCFCCTALWS